MDKYRLQGAGRDVHSSSSGDSCSEDDDKELPWKRRAVVKGTGHSLDQVPKPSVMDVDFKPTTQQKNNGAHPAKRGPNNIWGAVLQERFLTEDLHLIGIGNKYFKDGDRSVESYDYKKAAYDTGTGSDSSDEDSSSNSNSNHSMEHKSDKPLEVATDAPSRKRTVKDRLGKSTADLAQEDIFTLATETEIQTASAIAEKLNEPKHELMCRVVHFIGEEQANKIMHLTENVEEAGGMMTVDGSRRRTAGGVFFQLLKSDAHVTKEITDKIFQCERLQQEIQKRKQKKAHRRLRKKTKPRKENIAKSKSVDNLATIPVVSPAPAVSSEMVNSSEQAGKGADSEMEDGEIVD